MRDMKIRKMVLAALMAALTYVATMVVQIPSPMQGFVNLGDCCVLLSGWILGVGEKLNGAVDQAKKALGRFVDAVAVLIIINCVIPVLVLWFFLWLIKTAFSVDIHVPADRFLPGR